MIGSISQTVAAWVSVVGALATAFFMLGILKNKADNNEKGLFQLNKTHKDDMGTIQEKLDQIYYKMMES